MPLQTTSIETTTATMTTALSSTTIPETTESETTLTTLSTAPTTYPTNTTILILFDDWNENEDNYLLFSDGGKTLLLKDHIRLKTHPFKSNFTTKFRE